MIVWVGGLLPIADNTKNGLTKSAFAPFQLSDFAAKYLRVKKKESISFFLSYYGSSTNSNLYFVDLTLQGTNPKCIIKKIAELSNGNSLSGKQDSQYIYLTKPWGSTANTTIFPVHGKSQIEVDIITELPSDVTDIQIID